MIRWGRILLLAAALTVGCATATPTAWVDTASDAAGTLTVTPSPPQPMTPTTLTLSLVDEEGEPLTGAEVALDLSMPGMEMPQNQPACREVEDGVYEAQTMLTMGGIWCIRADVTTDDGSSTLAFYLTAE